jgi:hypothetical protein
MITIQNKEEKVLRKKVGEVMVERIEKGIEEEMEGTDEEIQKETLRKEKIEPENF